MPGRMTSHPFASVSVTRSVQFRAPTTVSSERPQICRSSSLQQRLTTSLVRWKLIGIAMGEAIGILKVFIVEGKGLAIRDFMSSDPYVVARVGDKVEKTKVISSCLNPVWNEELTFYVKEPVGDLKLEVFDWDRFKHDDEMGYAYLGLQPIVSASKLKKALKLTTSECEIRLRKVAPSRDNCLLVDSFVTFVRGEIVQDVYLKLLDVESGELYVKLK